MCPTRFLPEGLPEPLDDGAADHLPGSELPDLVLPSSEGAVNVRDFEASAVCLPAGGHPGRDLLPGWDEIPGARGCTPQSCGFRDHNAELAASRRPRRRRQCAEPRGPGRVRRAQPDAVSVLTDELNLARDPGLPTFDVEGLTLYKRLALVAERGRIVKTFYPVFPPDRNAKDVLDWLEARA